MALLVLALVCAVAVYVLISGQDTPEPEAAATEAVAAGDSAEPEAPTGGGAVEPSSEDTTTTGVRTVTGTWTTTVRPPFSNRFPIVCVVGRNAFVPDRYPPDGLCDFLFYAHVVFSNPNGRFVASENQDSFKLFTDMAAIANRSHYGISFDMKSLPQAASALNGPRARRDFSTLFVSNIQHHGVLNIIGSGTQVEKDMNSVLPMLPMIRKLQKEHKPRTPDTETYLIIGVELANIRKEAKMLQGLLVNASKAGANMLLLRTHVARWDLAEANGTAGGTMVMNPRGIRQPSILEAEPLLRRLRSPLRILLTSFTMGAALFRLPPEWQKVTDRDTSRIKPLSFEIADYSEVCSLHQPKTVRASREEIVVTGDDTRGYQLIFDDERAILEKMTLTYKALQIQLSWYNLGWAFFDVERDDHNDSCGPGMSFHRLKAARELIARDLSWAKKPSGWPPQVRDDDEDE